MESYRNYFFLCFSEAINLALRRKNVQNLIFVYLFFPKNSTTDYRKTFITLEWLTVDTCATPLWITFLMFYRLVCNTNLLISINYIWSFEKIFSKTICEYVLKIEVWLRKVLLYNSFSLRDFKMKKWNLQTSPTQTYKK